jgi:hypothetical protein
MAEGVAQVVEGLPSKCKALSSNPVPQKKKDRKKGNLIEKRTMGKKMKCIKRVNVISGLNEAWRGD